MSTLFSLVQHELMQIMSGDEEAKLDAELASLRAQKAAVSVQLLSDYPPKQTEVCDHLFFL
jgi:hypothetical protein